MHMAEEFSWYLFLSLWCMHVKTMDTGNNLDESLIRTLVNKARNKDHTL